MECCTLLLLFATGILGGLFGRHKRLERRFEARQAVVSACQEAPDQCDATILANYCQACLVKHPCQMVARLQRELRRPASQSNCQKTNDEPKRKNEQASSKARMRQMFSAAFLITGYLVLYCCFLTAKTHTTPPCGTLFSKPGTLPANASWMRCASTPQPDCTAMYCVPSTS